MASPFPVPIPYALTDAHRRKRIMRKVTVRPSRSCARWQPPALEQPSSTTIVLPIFDNQPEFAPSSQSRREHQQLQVCRMTVAQARPWKKKKLQPSQQKRRHPSLALGSQSAPRTTLRQSIIGPGTRLGATKYAPITIDDSAEEVVDREEESPTRVAFFSKSFVPSTPKPQRTSIYAPSPSSSATSEDDRFREASVYTGVRRKAAFGARTAPHSPMAYSEAHEYHSCPPHTSGLFTSPHHSSTTAPVARKNIPANKNHQAITLADITDAGTRKEVADLMAVAPALPVKDLHNLLVQSKDNVPATRTQAMGAIWPPSARPVIRSGRKEATGPPQNTRLTGYDYDCDEVMIKVDPNEPFLAYDTDSPPPEGTSPTTKGGVFKQGSKMKSGTKKPKQSSKHRPDDIVKMAGLPRKLGRKARGNSLTRFIDPENVVHLDTECSSSDADSSALVGSSDTDMEDAEDSLQYMTINMQPRYAYNSRILARSKARGR